MSGAIATATGDETTKVVFTHVGIAIRDEGRWAVLEATGDGVHATPLPDFLEKSAGEKDRPHVVAMRLRDTAGTAAATERARSYIGQPYDYSYRPDNGKLYCSELVWESYRAADGSPIFTARPMNFRATDGSMPAFWVELFSRIGEPIPENVPGTNPQSMSEDSLLMEVYRWF